MSLWQSLTKPLISTANAINEVALTTETLARSGRKAAERMEAEFDVEGEINMRLLKARASKEKITIPQFK